MVAVKPKRLGHDERRTKIIETTLLCLARDGADGTSLRSVCREMGVAPSLITHFFGSWHNVLTEAYGWVMERFMAQLSAVVKADFPSERDRMDAVISRYLSTDWIGESTIGANLALWQLSRSVIDLRPHYTKSMRDRRKLLRQALSGLAGETGAQLDLGELTTCFVLLLDGLWLEISVNPSGLSGRRAVELCWFWLDTALRPQEGAPPGARARTA